MHTLIPTVSKSECRPQAIQEVTVKYSPVCDEVSPRRCHDNAQPMQTLELSPNASSNAQPNDVPDSFAGVQCSSIGFKGWGLSKQTQG